MPNPDTYAFFYKGQPLDFVLREWCSYDAVTETIIFSDEVYYESSTETITIPSGGN